MKKLLMFLCCVLMMNGAWAKDISCGAQVRFRGQGVDSNEFLYADELNYNLAKSAHKDGNSGDGIVYECDNAACGKNKVVNMPANHYFKGELVPYAESYRCVIARILGMNLGIGDDRWVPVGKDRCDAGKTYGKIDLGEKYNGKLTYADCSAFDKTDHNQAEYDLYCLEPGPRPVCVVTKCAKADWEPNEEGRCVPVGGTQPTKKSCDSVVHGESETKDCPSNLSDGKQCKRTCDDGKWTDWVIVSCKKSGYVVSKGKCVPKSNGNNGGNNGSGQSGNNAGNNNGAGNGQSGGDEAGPVASVETPYACEMGVVSGWRAQYESCADVITALDELDLYCISSGRTEDGYKQKITKLQELRKVCEKEEADRKLRITKSTAIIGNASQKLDDIMAGLKVSAWKTAEGKFNTARLASDSIAGVVLGTAGGLITSHVVKKNQVKKGFEDIQCVVGGQKVADWADEFTVGIR